MADRYQTLALMADMLKEIPHPEQYQFIPRELILRSTYDWGHLYAHLQELQAESLVTITVADTIQFSITGKGLAFAGAGSLMVNK